jgi:beta-N-acetylhexosaminidase
MVFLFLYFTMNRIIFILLFTINTTPSFSQAFLQQSAKGKNWVDSVFNKLSLEEKIAQLFVIRAHSNLPQEHINGVTNLIKKYNVGGLCFFQGGPLRQANLTNYYQSIAKTPLLITIDAEWGVGMRLDSVDLFPKNMMLGAVENKKLVYAVGRAIGQQCKRLGIHINYAPVVDINNNPANPVINDRSFGEEKENVSRCAIEYIKGLQSAGVMGCAKHFPGHGDVNVDSHLDLPLINKSFESMDSLELYPFKRQIENNIGCIMTAHLSVPSIDSSINTPTSLSKKTILNLLKDKLGYTGLIITDGLEMKGVTKFYHGGEVSAKAIIAGNDLLCLPEKVDSSIMAIKQALDIGQITLSQLYNSVKKVLWAKYNLGLHKKQIISTKNLIKDLNKHSHLLVEKVAAQAITIVKQSSQNLFINCTKNTDLKHISIGNGKPNRLSNLLAAKNKASTQFFYNSFAASFKVRDSIEPRAVDEFKESEEKFTLAKSIIDSCKRKSYGHIIVSVHQYNRRPANNFGLDSSTLFLIQELGKMDNSTVLFFGNPYAIKNVNATKNIIACYEDNAIVQVKAYEILTQKIKPKGKLPVSIF